MHYVGGTDTKAELKLERRRLMGRGAGNGGGVRPVASTFATAVGLCVSAGLTHVWSGKDGFPLSWWLLSI